MIGEAGVTWAIGDKNELPGRLGLGGWGHTGRFATFSGRTDDGISGFYLVCDQTLWRENPEDDEDGQGIGLFFQYGSIDLDVSDVEQHVGFGFVWTGLLPGRDDDVAGVGLAGRLVAVYFLPGFRRAHLADRSDCCDGDPEDRRRAEEFGDEDRGRVVV